jgi:DNA-binding transcriptional MocR family regulator
MSRWFRFYTESLNDPKVQLLPAPLFKAWVNILCAASRYNGQLPSNSELAMVLARRSDHVQRDVNELIKRGLIDEINGHLEPHNWFVRQYKSDSSTPRVKRFRKRHSYVSETADETAPENREQNTERKKEEDTPSGSATDVSGKYVFQAGKAKLTQKTIDEWQKIFTELNVLSEVNGMGNWAELDQQNWFFALKGALSKRNREVLTARKTAANKPKSPYYKP